MTPAQLVLDLPHRAALEREDFLVSPANAAAVAMIDAWRDWPSHVAVLAGPPGSGKSHLVEVWRKAAGARRAEAGEISEAGVPDLLSTGALAVEDAPGPGLDERAMFHLLNLSRQQGGRVLITALDGPASWAITLPDLRSRLRAAPVTRLGPPDDALLRGVLVKLFSDRQLAVDEAVVTYLLKRMPRSFAAARDLVATLDAASLAGKAEITRSFVARTLHPLLSDAADDGGGPQ
jgi:chromosomal replication initiation ATPase DnaA